MSRVRINIDRIAVRGLDAADSAAVIDGLRGELARVLRDASALPNRSYRTPVIKLAPLSLPTGPQGARNLGVKTGGAIARKVRP